MQRRNNLTNLTNMRAESFDLIFATQGGVYVADTTLRAGPFAGYKALTDSTFSVVCNRISGLPVSPSTITVVAGDFLAFPGGGTNLQLATGSGIALHV